MFLDDDVKFKEKNSLRIMKNFLIKNKKCIMELVLI